MAKAKTASKVTKSPGRAPNPETADRLKKIVQFTRRKPGITNTEVAEKLDLGTLPTGQLADRLVKKGDLVLHKRGSTRTYYLPDQKIPADAKGPMNPPKAKAKAKAEAKPAAKKPTRKSKAKADA